MPSDVRVFAVTLIYGMSISASPDDTKLPLMADRI
jgi:hypothetical protein